MVRKKPTNSKKSGFQEGRATASRGPSASSSVKKNQQLLKAKNDLAEVLNNIDDYEGVNEDSEGDTVADRMAKFEQDFKRVRVSLLKSSNEFNADSATKTILMTMLSMNLQLIPIAERAFRTSKKENAMYSLLAIEKQTLEIASDLKLLGNSDHQSEFINDKILDPIFKSVTQNFIKEIISVKNTVEINNKSSASTRRINKDITDMAKSFGEFLENSKQRITLDINNYLSGNLKRFKK